MGTIYNVGDLKLEEVNHIKTVNSFEFSLLTFVNDKDFLESAIQTRWVCTINMLEIIL